MNPSMGLELALETKGDKAAALIVVLLLAAAAGGGYWYLTHTSPEGVAAEASDRHAELGDYEGTVTVQYTLEHEVANEEALPEEYSEEYAGASANQLEEAEEQGDVNLSEPVEAYVEEATEEDTVEAAVNYLAPDRHSYVFTEPVEDTGELPMQAAAFEGDRALRYTGPAAPTAHSREDVWSYRYFGLKPGDVLPYLTDLELALEEDRFDGEPAYVLGVEDGDVGDVTVHEVWLHREELTPLRFDASEEADRRSLDFTVTYDVEHDVGLTADDVEVDADALSELEVEEPEEEIEEEAVERDVNVTSQGYGNYSAAGEHVEFELLQPDWLPNRTNLSEVEVVTLTQEEEDEEVYSRSTYSSQEAGEFEVVQSVEEEALTVEAAAAGVQWGEEAVEVVEDNETVFEATRYVDDLMPEETHPVVWRCGDHLLELRGGVDEDTKLEVAMSYSC